MTQLLASERGDLEQLIDAHGLESVLSALCEICGEKAEHALSTWQDRGLARRWGKRGTALDRASAKIRALPVT